MYFNLNSKMNCSNNQQKLCRDYDCGVCFENSFASHEKSIHFSINNKVKPRDIDIFKPSSIKYLFNCVCGYELEKTIIDIITKQFYCPECNSIR